MLHARSLAPSDQSCQDTVVGDWGISTVRRAHDRQAESVDSSTDKTALRAIAKTLLNRDARLTGGSDLYAPLRGLTRQRRRIVHLSPAVKNRIHTHADCLFPGFLSKDSAVAAFTQPSLELMRRNFSAAVLARKSEKTLTRMLSLYVSGGRTRLRFRPVPKAGHS